MFHPVKRYVVQHNIIEPICLFVDVLHTVIQSIYGTSTAVLQLNLYSDNKEIVYLGPHLPTK